MSGRGPAGLTDGSLTGGVFRLLDPPADIATTLAAAGWRVAVVPSAGGTGQLWDHLAIALELPEWFGRNLDALWDVLTDIAQPTAIVLTGWTHYAQARPERWAALLALLEERAATDPPFAVVLTGGVPASS